jgi:hypothetical protein
MNWGKQTYTFDFVVDFSVVTSQDIFQTLSLDYPYSFGFRVGAVGTIPRFSGTSAIRPWSIEAKFARLTASISNSLGPLRGDVSDGNPAIDDFLVPETPFGILDGTSDNFLTGISSAHLTYNRGDLDLGWPIWLTRDSILELYLGGALAYFDSQWDSRFDGVLSAAPTSASSHLKWRWWGGGPKGGANIYLPIGWGLAFGADLDLGLLFGPVKKEEEYAAAVASSDRDGSGENLYRSYAFEPVIDFRVEMSERCAIGNKVLLEVALGWEASLWFYMNQYGQVNQRVFENSGEVERAQVLTFFFGEPSGLYFQGFTFRGGIGF